MLLITFDLSSLVYVYGSRMYIVSSFMQNLNKMFPEATENNSFFAITTRIVYTVIMNSILFGIMLALLGLQIYHENLDENKPEAFKAKEAERGQQLYYVSNVAGYMVMSTILVPILSIVIFILANYYYVLELMIKINVHVVENEKFREKLEDYGEVAQGIMGFAKQNVHATPGRLRDIQSLTTFQKVFYVLREWWIDLIFFLWTTIVILYCYFFYSYASQDKVAGTFYLIYMVSFVACVVMFTAGNYQTLLIVTVTNFIMIPLFLSFAGQSLVDKCRSLSSKVDAEKEPLEESISSSISEEKGEAERSVTQFSVVRRNRTASPQSATSRVDENDVDENDVASILPDFVSKSQVRLK